jgi:hypothetical protein
LAFTDIWERPVPPSQLPLWVCQARVTTTGVLDQVNPSVIDGLTLMRAFMKIADAADPDVLAQFPNDDSVSGASSLTVVLGAAIKYRPARSASYSL